MNSQQIKTLRKRKLLSSVVEDLVQTIKSNSSLQQVKELLENQAQMHINRQDESQVLRQHTIEQALEWIEGMQAKVGAQLISNVTAESPWFGSVEKRLTGLKTATIFEPVGAHQLAEEDKNLLTVQQQWLKVEEQSAVVLEQLMRKLDRLTGVRAKTDEWETIFPEDE